MIPRLSERRIVTYGLTPQADIRAVNVAIGPRRRALRRRHRRPPERNAAAPSPACSCRCSAAHNVQNSLAAIAVADEMGLDDDALRAALAGFKGVRRRFTKTGEWTASP